MYKICIHLKTHWWPWSKQHPTAEIKTGLHKLRHPRHNNIPKFTFPNVWPAGTGKVGQLFQELLLHLPMLHYHWVFIHLSPGLILLVFFGLATWSFGSDMASSISKEGTALVPVWLLYEQGSETSMLHHPSTPACVYTKPDTPTADSVI